MQAAISDDESLGRFGEVGTGAGQLEFPWGVAADPITGHVFTAEEGNNNRVSEFTPWGNFVKAFGWDVAPGAVNEQQELRIRASAGQFKLTFEGNTTTDLPFNASAAEVEAALNALPSIGAGDTSVKDVPGTTSGTTPFIHVVAFKGSLAATNVPQLVIANGATTPSGGVPTTVLEARTRADGHAATTGLESCTAESGCKAGISGNGAGQFNRARGVVLDAVGNLYVREVSNLRVQKFDSAGRFLLSFGGEGTGDGQFAPGLSGGIALCAGTLYVADKDRIQKFDSNGVFSSELPIPAETVQRLACDPVSGGLYATFEPDPDVRRLDPNTGEEVGDSVPAEGFLSIATDPAGNLFVGSLGKAREFDPSGDPLTPPSCCASPPFGIEGLGFNSAGTLYASYATSGVDSFLRAFGPPPVSFELPPLVPPEISAQFANSVGIDGATVAADINPNFFTDTTYYVEYGTGECKAGGCDKQVPLAPGTLLTTKAVKAALRSGEVSLEDLEPGTTYHYRFVSVSTGGGPVYGIDPDGEGPEEASPTTGEEAQFTTFPLSAPPRSCPNEALRLGSATRLPDCRAYEMVSPVDKNNGDILTLLDLASYTTGLYQSATDGGRFTYSSYRGFANPKAAPYTNQYLAKRHPQSGWASESLNLAQNSGFSGDSFENHAKAFTEDLCTGLLMITADPAPAPGATPERPNVYRRDNCAGGSLEALVQLAPEPDFYPVVQGISVDGTATVFAAREQLTPEAAANVWQIYYASGGSLALVCVLPNGNPSSGNCSTGRGEGEGMAGQVDLERFSTLTHALSEDGTKVYWTNSAGQESGPGKIYLRLNPGEEQSAMSGEECTEAEKACTVKVSETVSTQPSRFLGASADGTRALFEVLSTGNLYRFDLETLGSTLIAGDSRGVAAASEDLARVYFVSEEALVGDAVAGEPNLYLDDGGVPSFIATLAAGDVVGAGGVSNTNPRPVRHAARATPDGSVLTFISSAPLTGYDNTDQLSGKADLEVYLFEAGAGGPVCVSCNPSGARPRGGVVAVQLGSDRPTAAWLPLAENAIYSPRVLSTDGNRLVFNSFDALLPRDTNGTQDVYQWQKASGQAVCNERGAELFVPEAGGCISLISTGESPEDSTALDTSANGGDIFFTTNASLLPRDPGLVDVYDARAGGGIAELPPPPPVCQGETCQPAVPAPNDPTPSSSSYVGPEDEKAKKKQKKAKKKAKNKNKKKAKKKGKGKKKPNNAKQGGRR